jgi:predicted metal-dependent hydrolase
MIPLRQLALPLAGPLAPEPDLAVPPAPAPPPTAAELQFVRRRGTRRYILRVLEDGSLRVTLPWWGSKRDARAFVASQAEWIARQRARRAEAPDRRWRAGDSVLLDGEHAPLTVDSARPPRIWCAGDAVAAAPGGDDLRPVVERWLRRRAMEQLPAELMALAERHGITVTRVSVRNQQSRWGSCSRRGTISLNWRLVQTPPYVREYVLVHELMHRRELNHSARFWRHVAAACPRYVEARRWLRGDGARLF